MGEEEEETEEGLGNSEVVLILCLENNTCHQTYSSSISCALSQSPAGAHCGKAPSTSAELCSVSPGRDLAGSICSCGPGREGFQLRSSELPLLPLSKALTNSHVTNWVISALEPPHVQSSSKTGIAAVLRQCVELHPPSHPTASPAATHSLHISESCTSPPWA